MNTRISILFAGLVAILLIAGCDDNIIPDPGPDTTGLFGDYLGQAPPDITPARFTPDILLPDESWWWISPPKFSPDGNELVFTRYVHSNPDTKHLYSMRRLESDEWTSPEEVPFGSHSGDDCHAAFSIDGERLYFLSHRAGGPFLYVTGSATDGWSDPVPIVIPNISGVGNQFCVTRDETIYFEMSNGQADDLYRSRLVNGAYGEPESLSAINTDEYEEYAPYIDPDEDYLIFASNRPGGYGGNDLYISFQNPDGSWTEPENMGASINSPAGDTIPYISPDGNYFFFITQRTGDPGYNPYWMDAQIIEDFRPHVPLDGRGGGVIAFVSTRNGGDHDIFAMNADGSGVTALTSNNASDFSPDWLPDGIRIAFESDRDGDRDIYVMDADGGNVLCLTANSSFTDLYPDWSPDGSRILFTSIRDNNWDLYVMDADGSNLQRLTNHPALDEGGRWSPDGNHILFTTDRDGNQEVYCMDSNGSILVRLTNHPGMDCRAQWSPDGSTIVYVSPGNGEDIWLMEADGSNKRALVTNAANDFVPCWSPDGSSVAFQTSYENNNDEIAVINVTTGRVTRVTSSADMDTFPAWKEAN